MLPYILSTTTSLSFSIVFDAIVILFTVIYLLLGYKRGMKNALWHLLFNLASILGAYLVAKVVYPLFADAIPLVIINMTSSIGLSFMIAVLLKLFISYGLGIITFLILKFIVFNRILASMDDHDYVRQKKKNVIGRVVSSLLSGWLAFTLSSAAIMSVNSVLTYTSPVDYQQEMNNSLVAKYGVAQTTSLYEVMIDTNSIENQNDVFLKTITDGKYSASDLPSYRESLYRLMIVNDVESYVAAIDLENNPDAAISRFSQDLVVWASLIEREDMSSFKVNLQELLNGFVEPIANEIASRNVEISEDVHLFPYENHLSSYSKEVVTHIEKIFN